MSEKSGGDIMNPTDEDIRRSLIRVLGKIIKKEERELEKKKAVLKKLEEKENFIYRVRLDSLWNEEKTVIVSNPDLETAMKLAIDKFKKVNHRGDVQAKVSVYALIGKTAIAVCETKYMDLYNKMR
ncbi:MAG: hypothetical protein PHX30_05415 [Candidatus Pacebacteria bacterium]|jgi:hypothetical protein|nr:hypothetical protein [Candidatus Paceibacterota bacterium]